MFARPFSGLMAVQAPALAQGSGGQVMESVRRRGASHSSSEGVGGNTPTLSTDPALSSRDGASLDELRAEWRRLYLGEAPRLSRDLLVRGIGYRRQKIELGGLGKSTRRPGWRRTRSRPRAPGRAARQLTRNRTDAVWQCFPPILICRHLTCRRRSACRKRTAFQEDYRRVRKGSSELLDHR
jgi:hypothetical protein